MASNNQQLRITAEEWSAQESRGSVVRINGQPHVVINNAVNGEPEYHPVVILDSESDRQRAWAGFREARSEARREAPARGQQAQADGT